MSDDLSELEDLSNLSGDEKLDHIVDLGKEEADILKQKLKEMVSSKESELDEEVQEILEEIVEETVDTAYIEGLRTGVRQGMKMDMSNQYGRLKSKMKALDQDDGEIPEPETEDISYIQ